MQLALYLLLSSAISVGSSGTMSTDQTEAAQGEASLSGYIEEEIDLREEEVQLEEGEFEPEDQGESSGIATEDEEESL